MDLNKVHKKQDLNMKRRNNMRLPETNKWNNKLSNLKSNIKKT
jgi:hypothetical protein